MWDTNGTRARVDPKLRSKLQPKYGSGAGAGVDPHTHIELRWDIDGTGARARVDPKFQSKSTTQYGSRTWSRSGVDPHPPKFTLFWYSYGDKTLDDSSCKKCIISTSVTYILHTYEKGEKKNRVHSTKWNSPIIVSRNYI